MINAFNEKRKGVTDVERRGKIAKLAAWTMAALQVMSATPSSA